MTRTILLLLITLLGAQGLKAQTDSVKPKDLKAITITGSKPYVTLKADKMVINVSESPIAAGGTAALAISSAPGIADQGAGNYEFKGKKLLVLIDGKDARLSGDNLKEMLESLPANSIDRIEVLSSPSARYDAKGAAILNIITKRSKTFGTNGTLTAGIGTGVYGRYNAGLDLNYRNEHLNLFGGYDHTYYQQFYKDASIRTLSNNGHITANSLDIRTRHNNNFRLGMDYKINKNQSFGVFVKSMLNYRDRTVHNRSTLDPENEFSDVATNGKATVLNPSVNVYYKAILDTTGKQLTINADYLGYHKDWDDVISTVNHFENEPYLLQNHSPADNTVKAVSADYSQPFLKGELEAGVKATLTKTDNDINWLQLQEKAWVTDKGKTNHFIYHEDIYAAYLSYSRSIKKFDFSAGLRAEQTNTKGNSLTLNQINKRRKLNFFPNASITWNKSEKEQYSAAYRESIERYGFDVVNPFITYVSEYFYYSGNPDIRPSISRSFEIDYAYNNQWFASLSYQHFSGVPADVYLQDTGNVVVSKQVNLRSANSANASVSWSRSFLNNKWNTTNMLMMTYAQYNEPGAGNLNNAGFGAFIKTNNIITLPKGLTAEVSGSYFSSFAYGAFKFKPRYIANVGIAKSVLHNKGKLTFNVSDLFNTLTSQYDVSSFGVNSTFNSKVESRFYKLVFSYKFGNQKVKAATKKATGIEEQQQRMGSN